MKTLELLKEDNMCVAEEEHPIDKLSSLLNNMVEIKMNLKYENLNSYILSIINLMKWNKNHGKELLCLNEHFLVCKDCESRINDWVESEGDKPHPYIDRQIKFIKDDFHKRFMDIFDE